MMRAQFLTTVEALVGAKTIKVLLLTQMSAFANIVQSCAESYGVQLDIISGQQGHGKITLANYHAIAIDKWFCGSAGLTAGFIESLREKGCRLPIIAVDLEYGCGNLIDLQIKGANFAVICGDKQAIGDTREIALARHLLDRCEQIRLSNSVEDPVTDEQVDEQIAA